jgi:DNA-directed RNA polymerase specialized sigma24 family protein
MRTFVLRNNGSEEEAQDIFQNAVVTVYNLAKRGKLDLTVKFNTFLLAVGNRMWLRQLKRKGIINFVKIEDGSENDYHEEDYQIEEEVYETMESVEKKWFLSQSIFKTEPRLSNSVENVLRQCSDTQNCRIFRIEKPGTSQKEKISV